MDKKLKNTLESVSVKTDDKSNKLKPEKQISLQIYEDIANQAAVKTEIGDVIQVFNEIIKTAKIDVDFRKSENPIKYSQRGFYSQDLNATIKENLIKRIYSDQDFSKKVRIRKNSGSNYFIIKDKYILYVKRLYGKQNKPNSYPTINSEKLFSGTLFPSLNDHIPVLFIGPNLSKIEANDAFVTSLISRHELNWSLESTNLFNQTGVMQLSATEKVVEQEKVVVKLKKSLESPDKKVQNN